MCLITVRGGVCALVKLSWPHQSCRAELNIHRQGSMVLMHEDTTLRNLQADLRQDLGAGHCSGRKFINASTSNNEQRVCKCYHMSTPCTRSLMSHPVRKANAILGVTTKSCPRTSAVCNKHPTATILSPLPVSLYALNP